jgi:hypothetical protein
MAYDSLTKYVQDTPIEEIDYGDIVDASIQEAEEVKTTPLNVSPEQIEGIPSISTYKEVFPEGSIVEKDFHPSNRRKVSQGVPFIMKMVDRNFRTSGIKISTGPADQSLFVMTGIKFSPNPTTLSINSSKIINRYNTMTRWVEEHWGEEIDNIMFSGSTLSFLGYGTGFTEDVGLTVKDRGFTMPYAMIREMARFFKTNGMIFQDNKTYDDQSVRASSTNSFLGGSGNSALKEEHPLTGVPKERLYINLFFDYVSFLGYFESFDIIEESNSPYRFTYNCVFKAERTKYHQGLTATSRASSDVEVPTIEGVDTNYNYNDQPNTAYV